MAAVLMGANCNPDAPPEIAPPLLDAPNLFDLGESPQGIRTRKVLTLSNAGEAGMVIEDYELKPDTGSFFVNFPELPLTLKKNETLDVAVTFLPSEVRRFEVSLELDYNHAEERHRTSGLRALASPIGLFAVRRAARTGMPTQR